MSLRDIARIIHEINRAHCAANGKINHHRWEDETEFVRAMVVRGVCLYANHLLPLTPRDVEGEDAKAWWEQMVRMGWSVGTDNVFRAMVLALYHHVDASVKWPENAMSPAVDL